MSTDADDGRYEALTFAEQRFVEARMLGLSLADAARQAGSASTDPDVLKAVGWKIEARPRVAREIVRRRAALAVQAEADQREMVAILVDLARADIAPLIGLDPAHLGFLPPQIRRAVKKLTIKDKILPGGIVERRTEIEVRDPVAAIAQLARMLAWNAPEKSTLMIEHRPGEGAAANEDFWRDGLRLDEVIAYGRAIESGDTSEAARLQALGTRRLHEAAARLSEENRR